MFKKCKISIKEIDIIVYLNEKKTAVAIWDELPLRSFIKFWGKEIYFSCNINVELDKDSKSVIKYGEIVFWPRGNCIAIGYGQTPMSIHNEIRLADKCNIWGYSKSNLHQLDLCSDNDSILIEKIE